MSKIPKKKKKVFANLSLIAKRAFCVVGSSVASEALFSETGYIISKRRNGLLPIHVQQLSFIRQNCVFAKEQLF